MILQFLANLFSSSNNEEEKKQKLRQLTQLIQKKKRKKQFRENVLGQLVNKLKKENENKQLKQILRRNNELDKEQYDVKTERNELLKDLQNLFQKRKIDENELIKFIQIYKYNDKTGQNTEIKDTRTNIQTKKDILKNKENRIVQEKRMNDKIRDNLLAEFSHLILISEFSVYFALICIFFMIIINTLVLKAKNPQKKLTGIVNIIDKGLFSISFMFFLIYFFSINVSSHYLDIAVISILYSLCFVIMMLIYQKKVINIEEFKERDKKNLFILFSLKISLLSVVLIYMLFSIGIFNKVDIKENLVNKIKERSKHLKVKAKEQINKGLGLLFTTIGGIIGASLLKFLDD
jgi:energy-converting hydrogenase Eha subunit C